jgi:hypothetical protein
MSIIANTIARLHLKTQDKILNVLIQNKKNISVNTHYNTLINI